MPNPLVPILFGLILGHLFLKKKKESYKKISISFKVFTFLWINILCLLLSFLLPELFKNSYAYIAYPKYEAEIVDIRSKYVWSNDRGGRSRRLMHTPILKFKPDDSKKFLKIPLNISSNKKPKVGEIRRVAFENNAIYEISTKGYLFLVGIATLTLFSFYPILYIVFSILGKDTVYLKKLGVKSIIYMTLIATITFLIIVFRSI